MCFKEVFSESNNAMTRRKLSKKEETKRTKKLSIRTGKKYLNSNTYKKWDSWSQKKSRSWHSIVNHILIISLLLRNPSTTPSSSFPKPNTYNTLSKRSFTLPKRTNQLNYLSFILLISCISKTTMDMHTDTQYFYWTFVWITVRKWVNDMKKF